MLVPPAEEVWFANKTTCLGAVHLQDQSAGSGTLHTHNTSEIAALHMVVDRRELSANLRKFYDFSGKAAVCVGAGGGLLLEPASGVASVVAIDKNAEELEKFRVGSKASWAGTPLQFVPRKFEEVDYRGDVVYFEFCMHMMEDPRKTLEHARSLAQDIVAIDHLPGSKWVYYWAGEDEVRRSTEALESFGIKRRSRFVAEQRFKDWQALADRLTGLGEESRRRVLELKEAKEVHMPMDYCLYLL